MKKFVLMVAMVVSCVCMAQNSHAQTGRDGNTDIDMLSMKNFYAIDIVDVDLAAQEAIYNAYENCLIKEVYKSNGSGSPIQYKVSLETTDQRNLVVAFDESGHVLKVMLEDEYWRLVRKTDLSATFLLKAKVILLYLPFETGFPVLLTGQE